MNECQRLRRVSRGSIATATPKKQAFPIYPPGSYTNRVGCLAWRNVDNAQGASAADVAIKDGRKEVRRLGVANGERAVASLAVRCYEVLDE